VLQNDAWSQALWMAARRAHSANASWSRLRNCCTKGAMAGHACAQSIREAQHGF
jgi:hypothetical protein